MFNTQKSITSGEYELVRDCLCSVRCNYPKCIPEECSQLEIIKVNEDYIVVCPKSQLVNLVEINLRDDSSNPKAYDILPTLGVFRDLVRSD